MRLSTENRRQTLSAAEADGFTPSAAMHKHTARPTVRRAVTGNCYAANDAKSS
jgi:hypothetical protein